jgi:hypothetical protein
MTNLKQHIEKMISSSDEDRMYVRLRKDMVKKAIEAGEFEAIVCDFHYTDDYAWDNANNFGKGTVKDPKSLVKDFDRMSNLYCSVKRDKPNEISISIHSNLSYTMHLKNASSVTPEKAPKTPAKKAKTINEAIVTAIAKEILEEKEPVTLIMYTLNTEFNGIEISFPTIPAATLRTEMKSLGFKWHSVKKVWYAKNTEARLSFTKRIARTA